uniref:C3HC-type domain-containing protein n=1 Tax=Parastrongyloides trichosuri TaxID=131310 RepID=A0A0N4Z8S4_PARTI
MDTSLSTENEADNQKSNDIQNNENVNEKIVDFNESIKVAEKATKCMDEYILFGTSSYTESYRKDKDALRKRLKTYLSKNWKITSQKITPLQCALLGWISISGDYLQCSSCKKCVSLKFVNGSRRNSLSYHENIQILKKELRSSHKNYCRQRLLFNYNQLEKCYSMLTECDIQECKRSFTGYEDISWDFLNSSIDKNGSVKEYLANCGFYFEGEYVKCFKCFYDVSVKKKNFLNPKIHHKPWCPLLLFNNISKDDHIVKGTPFTTLNRLQYLIKELKDDSLKVNQEKNEPKNKGK